MYGRHNPYNWTYQAPAGEVNATPVGVEVKYPTVLPHWYNAHVQVSSCKNAAGEDVGYEVYNETQQGFWISVVENATAKYDITIF